MKKIFYSLLCLALVSCSSAKQEVLHCPGIGFMQDATEVVFFNPQAANPTLDDVQVYAHLDNLNGTCQMLKNEKSASKKAYVALTFDVAARRHETAVDIKKQDISYFVAVIAPDESILQSQKFDTSVDLKKESAGLTSEEQRVTIPLPETMGTGEYKIVIGLIMSPKQAEFLKAAHSIKAPTQE